ncbi:hypothetical protein SteCoe_4085 [Stentor coeruleus]|uniref:Palmitoyltransferase n=1 Tax=Stentor coeruleus TaxID=5963 RepID=A0A1R2CVG9_9CILI|nr:hypothetical protein SteCoe_4085 [Stentor coeruleus]
MRIVDYWQGKNKFFCKASIITGPDWYKGILTGGFSILISCLIYAFPLNFYVQEETYAPVIIFTILLPISIYYLFSVATHDPGYIPKQSLLFTTKANDALNEYITSPKPLLIQHKGTIMKMKFCKTCMLFRPPRSSHCSICDLCVEEFDHHCPWIGNCVGKRNYVYFFKFLLSMNLLSITAFICSICHVSNYENSNKEDRKSLIVSFILIVLLFFVLFFVCGLFGFHLYLVLTGITTNEKIKQTWPKSDFNPFTLGSPLGNCGIKYKARKSKPQFDPKAMINQYADEINPNLVLRKVKLLRTFGTAEDTVEKKMQMLGNKPPTSRPQTPLMSECS